MVIWMMDELEGRDLIGDIVSFFIICIGADICVCPCFRSFVVGRNEDGVLSLSVVSDLCSVPSLCSFLLETDSLSLHWDCPIECVSLPVEPTCFRATGMKNRTDITVGTGKTWKHAQLTCFHHSQFHYFLYFARCLP